MLEIKKLDIPVNDRANILKRSGLIFRIYRKTKSGKILDAYEYGYQAWPIKL